MEKATFAGGCFWCTEAIFKRLKGVESVIPGYTGGKVPNPSYEQISTGSTGHTESIQLTFNPQIISYSDLLTVFWKTHDPTTLNKQGADVGTQYRSAIFYHSEDQKLQAEQLKKTLQASSYYPNPIVTEIAPATEFYPAEPYHKDYYERNRSQPYCQIVIDPKIQKLQKDFTDILK